MIDAPGLLRRKRTDGSYAYYWVAKRVSRHAKDYPLKTIRLSSDEEDAAARCRVLTAELREWLASRETPEYTGTIASLIDCYQRDEDSPYHAVSTATRRNDYDPSLTILKASVGEEVIDDLHGKHFTRWFREFRKPAKTDGPERLRRAHGCMKLLRTILRYGASRRYLGCAELVIVLEHMKFEAPAPREGFLTFDQASAIVDHALKIGRRSIALAQALQFETTLRQKDVIGEWNSDPTGRSGMVDRDAAWSKGIMWSDIDAELILRKKTSKTKARGEWNLKLYPLIAKALEAFPLELARLAEARPVPLIVSESTGRPYRQHDFGRQWRAIADAAGVPRTVWNMDSRAGGITEGDAAGADPRDVQRQATHADARTTGRYVRQTLKATERVATARVASRKKEK